MKHAAPDPHPHGLHHDLALLELRAQQRRRVLGMLAFGGAYAAIGACSGSSNGASSNTGGTGGTTGTGGTGSSACTAYAGETNGPYPSDGSNTINGTLSNALNTAGIVRNDITASFAGMTGTAAGVPMTLNLTLQNSNGNCAALDGYAVYLWHCDAAGNYSLYSATVQDQNWLRGVQVSDSAGMLSFASIVPGCYAGRYPHIHFEIYRNLASTAPNNQNAILTSQFALPAAACSDVYANGSGYGASAANFAGVSIASDGVFGNNSAAQMAVMTLAMSGSAATGYTATALVGVPA